MLEFPSTAQKYTGWFDWLLEIAHRCECPVTGWRSPEVRRGIVSSFPATLPDKQHR